MPAAPSTGMIGHLTQRTLQDQRELSCDEFSTFCDDQVARVRRSLRVPAVVEPHIPLGECQRFMLAPETYALSVRA